MLGMWWVRIWLTIVALLFCVALVVIMKWWVLVLLFVVAIVWWWRQRAPNVRVNVPVPKPRWSCNKCGYSLDEIPEQEGIAEGVHVVRPTCPECGHRQLE